SDGDFSVRVPEKGQYRETEELTHAFNTMADRISSNEASRREFVANVSHELRSPITSISGFVTGMLDGTIPEEKHAEYLKIVEGETRRLTKLISDLLALSRLEREDAMLTCTDFDICELFRQAVIRRVSDLEKKQMDLVCDFAEESCMVHADRDRIEQVIVNLLDNAIKFTPEGGNITLCVRREGDRCRMEVRDSGIGIASEDRDRIFERFFTVDRAHTSGKGTGLGLSICQRILQMHGESIRLLDTEEGAAFAFYLPAGHGKDRTDREEERDA
ncbi:MAG: HAMP domain-containing histidine kinase, partial [Clostridia bacterium]|nr:HAMP domain-containing histidine kinase [Clostridia bacterium]